MVFVILLFLNLFLSFLTNEERIQNLRNLFIEKFNCNNCRYLHCNRVAKIQNDLIVTAFEN